MLGYILWLEFSFYLICLLRNAFILVKMKFAWFYVSEIHRRQWVFLERAQDSRPGHWFPFIPDRRAGHWTWPSPFMSRPVCGLGCLFLLVALAPHDYQWWNSMREMKSCGTRTQKTREHHTTLTCGHLIFTCVFHPQRPFRRGKGARFSVLDTLSALPTGLKSSRTKKEFAFLHWSHTEFT